MQVSLAATLPLSRFQQQCLSLQRILPSVADPSLAQDWLDNDLTPVLHFSEAALGLRTRLVDVPLWHDSPSAVSATKVEVYTDGSAFGTTEPLPQRVHQYPHTRLINSLGEGGEVADTPLQCWVFVGPSFGALNLAHRSECLFRCGMIAWLRLRGKGRFVTPSPLCNPIASAGWPPYFANACSNVSRWRTGMYPTVATLAMS